MRHCYWRWQRTLQRLAIRYRKPYVARHTSVSWNLMIGRSPLLVAKEHGHRLTTRLSVYAAWTEGAAESDIGGGCHLNRPIRSLIESAGFRIESLDRLHERPEGRDVHV
jgi:hypothetical protein